VKDEHLQYALRHALTRYGTPELPPNAADDAAHRTVRPRRRLAQRPRRPGWVSIGEVEASQPPNSYPRLSRRAIKTRCRDLAREGGGPVQEVRTLGLRTWVRVAFPQEVASLASGAAGEQATWADPTAAATRPQTAVTDVPEASYGAAAGGEDRDDAVGGWGGG
jgi:hypothetical protein